MKSTQNLSVTTSFVNSDKVVIHPNNGFELDLYLNSYNYNFFLNITEEEFLKNRGEQNYLKLELSNDCKTGTIELPKKIFLKMNKPNVVKLILKDEAVLISIIC